MPDLPPPRYGERVPAGPVLPPPPTGLPATMAPPVALRPPIPGTPKKWLGRRGGLVILGGFAAVWLYLLLFGSLVAHSHTVTPTAVILGGFALASALVYTMAYRLRPQDGITVTRLLLAFLLGGLVSTVIAATVNFLIDHAAGGTNDHPSLTALSLAGVVEELSKIIAVVIVSRKLANRSARNGLFIGGAVGLGFSAIEDMSYQLKAFDLAQISHSPVLSLIQVAVERDILGPFEHPIYTALFAAALFAASRNGRFRITLGVVGTYASVAFVHGLVDSSGGWLGILLHDPRLGDGLGFLFGLLLAAISGLVWFLVSRHLRNRMRAAEHDLLPPPPPQLYAPE